MSLGRVVAGIGRTLIAVGVVLLLFVAYQLWGTGLTESHSQEVLRHQLAARPPPAQGPTAVPLVATGPAKPTPPPPEGDAVGLIKIPRIGADTAIVEGTGTADLRQGPGHYPGTSLPGQPGNAAIAGHRTTYGAPFYNLNELTSGDPIYITTPQGTFRYNVGRTLIVSPDDVSVIAPSPNNELTLTTCNPRFSAAQRLIVQASLVGAPASAAPVVPKPRVPRLAGDTTSWLPSIAWGLGAVAVAFAVWLIAHFRRRRWPVYVLGAPAFLGVLFFYFAAISQLLPASI